MDYNQLVFNLTQIAEENSMSYNFSDLSKSNVEEKSPENRLFSSETANSKLNSSTQVKCTLMDPRLEPTLMESTTMCAEVNCSLDQTTSITHQKHPSMVHNTIDHHNFKQRIFLDQRLEPTLMENSEIVNYLGDETLQKFQSSIDNMDRDTNPSENNLLLKGSSSTHVQDTTHNQRNKKHVFLDSKLEPTLLEDSGMSDYSKCMRGKNDPTFDDHQTQNFSLSNEEGTEFIPLKVQDTELSTWKECYRQLEQLYKESEEKKRKALYQLNEKEKTIRELEKRLFETQSEKHRHQLEQQVYKENERQKDELLLRLDEKQQLIDQLEEKLDVAQTEMDSFEQLEDKMFYENFQLKKELLKLKLRFELISMEEACKELGCCASDFLDEIKLTSP